MATSKTAKKLLAELKSLQEKTEAAIARGAEDEVIECGKAFHRFLSEHQELLSLPDEQINEVKIPLDKIVEKTNEIAKVEAQTRRLERQAERLRQSYLQALLEEPPSGKKRINH